MTEKTVNINRTTEINNEAIKREISAEGASLDGEMIKLMIELMREAIAEGLEAIYDQIQEREAKGWKTRSA